MYGEYKKLLIYAVYGPKSRIAERPNFLFSINPIEKGEKCLFYISVENRNKLHDEENNFIWLLIQISSLWKRNVL